MWINVDSPHGVESCSVAKLYTVSEHARRINMPAVSDTGLVPLRVWAAQQEGSTKIYALLQRTCRWCRRLCGCLALQVHVCSLPVTGHVLNMRMGEVSVRPMCWSDLYYDETDCVRCGVEDPVALQYLYRF